MNYTLYSDSIYSRILIYWTLCLSKSWFSLLSYLSYPSIIPLCNFILISGSNFRFPGRFQKLGLYCISQWFCGAQVINLFGVKINATLPFTKLWIHMAGKCIFSKVTCRFQLWSLTQTLEIGNLWTSHLPLGSLNRYIFGGFFLFHKNLSLLLWYAFWRRPFMGECYKAFTESTSLQDQTWQNAK